MSYSFWRPLTLAPGGDCPSDPPSYATACGSFISEVSVSAHGPGWCRLTRTDQRKHSLQVRRMKEQMNEGIIEIL